MGPAMGVQLLGAAIGLIGGMRQASAQERAADEARVAAERSEYLAERNAARIEAETAEATRREAKAQRVDRMRALAERLAGGAAASSGTVQAVISEMQTEDRRALDWLQRSGANRADIERERGRTARSEGYLRARGLEDEASTSRWQGFGTFVSGAGRAYALGKD